MSDSVVLVAIFAQMSKLVKGLSEDDLKRVGAGEIELKLVPKGSKVVVPLNLPALAAEVRQLGSQDAIVRLLDGDQRLTPAVLKKLADELNISVPASVKGKGALQLHIAQSAASHWQRTRGGL